MYVCDYNAYYFPGPLRQPEIIVVASNEIEAKAEFKKISGKVMPPKKVHAVVIASPELQEILQVERQGDTPKRKYEVVDPWEFPLLDYFGPYLPDTEDDKDGWDVQSRFINEAIPWLHLEDGEDLRQRLINEIDKWERRYL